MRISDMPSLFKLYDVDHFNMKLFGMPELKEISRAITLDSLAPVIDVMSSCLDFDAATLTDADFFWLLWLQRFHGYRKAPVADWICDHIVFEDGTDRYTFMEVEASLQNREDEGLATRVMHTTSCGHRNVTPVTKDSVEIAYLGDFVLPDELQFPRIASRQEYIQMLATPDLQSIAGAARWLREGKTLMEKLQIFESMETLDLFQTALHLEESCLHGATVITANCDACRQPRAISLDTDLRIFFKV